MRYVAVLVAIAAVASSGCRTTLGGAGNTSATLSDDPDRPSAFATVKDSLMAEALPTRVTLTQDVMIDANTDPSVIAGIVAPKNPDPTCLQPTDRYGQPCLPRGATPANLEGTYWMRGNPLPDYLLSFANSHWTTVNGIPFSYLATFAPGSFAWKEKLVATGGDPTDFQFLPEICRVPKDDATLNQIAHFKATYDASTYRRPIAEDFAAMNGSGTGAGPVADADVQTFINGVWQTGQFPLDGAQLVQTLRLANVFYEAKFSPDYKTTNVIVFSLLDGLPAPGPVQIDVPEAVASFSFAPHFADKDIFVRKTFIEGVSKTPNYYFLTRIVDGQGAATPHFKEFLQCVGERSGGRLLKSVPPGA